MRTLTLALCLGLLLVALLPAPARAGDDEDRLARRVEMLLDLVAEMKAEIEELKARVGALEREAKTADDDDEEELPPFVTVEPQPVPEPVPPEEISTAPDVSGTYAMDKGASVQAVIEKMSAGADEEDLVEIRLMVESQFESIHMELHLTKQGIFEASMKTPPAAEGDEEGERHSARGTWERAKTTPKDGSTHLILRTTHEDGEEAAHGETIEGVWRPDGSLRLQQPEDDFVLIFNRK